MKNLYKFAEENIKEIAEESLESVYFTARKKTVWLTLDGLAFESKPEALKHQIDFLQSDEEDRTFIV